MLACRRIDYGSATEAVPLQSRAPAVRCGCDSARKSEIGTKSPIFCASHHWPGRRQGSCFVLDLCCVYGSESGSAGAQSMPLQCPRSLSGPGPALLSEFLVAPTHIHAGPLGFMCACKSLP